MKLSSWSFRKIHKWIGLILGLQFLLWTVSGLGMALLDHEQVSGGHSPETPPVQMPGGSGWAKAVASLGQEQVEGVAVRPLLGRQIFEIDTPDGSKLFDGETGEPIRIDANFAQAVATASYHGAARVARVEPLKELTLAVREHEMPILQVDFADKSNNSFYISGKTGKLLERRNDSWRLWDFLWMLHNMDYLNRSSFNHPLIVVVTFFTLWLAISGFYLLFTTGWRKDLRWLRRERKAAEKL